MEFKAKTTVAEDERILNIAQTAIQEMIDAVEVDSEGELDAPTQSDVRRAAKDLVAAILEALEIEV